VKVGGRPLTVVHCVMAAAALLLLTRCIRAYEAKKSIHWDILVTIACALGVSRAMDQSGLAAAIAGWVVEPFRGLGPHGVLFGIYLTTLLITEIMSNNAAAALTFPIAVSAAAQLGVDPRPFCVAVTIAASAGFATPIGYQTNLIVQGAGGYKFIDYVKAGLPLNLIVMAVAVTLIPVFWHF
jgi:di/tricarboxylate transporter